MILHRILRSSTFRIGLLYAAIFSASVLMLLWFIYWSTAGFMERQTDETISAEIQGLAEQYTLRGLIGLVATINERTSHPRDANSLYLLTDENYNPMAGNLAQWPFDVTESEGGWISFQLHASDREDPVQARARRFVLQGNFRLLVGRDVSERVKTQRLIINSLGWGLAMTIVLGLAGALLISRAMLRRIDVINRISRDIMRGDLDRRIPAKGAGDEFDQLAKNLNSMLDQIERLMAGIRQVSDNIAHDLRSPLNRIRGRLEYILISQPDQETTQQILEETIGAVDELLGTFNALLKIAQAEAGARREDVEELDLSSLAADLAELYQPLAEDKHQSFIADIQPGVAACGNRHLLSQAVANLLDNAVKYTPEHGHITLRVHDQHVPSAGPVLEVADSGPGVPEHLRPRVLERFYRMESSRNAPGSGLGLSLVNAVVRLHDATMHLDDNTPGLRVRIEFPPLQKQ